LTFAGGCNVGVLFKKEVYYAPFCGGHRGEAEWSLLSQDASGGTMSHPLDSLDAALSITL
jgi:hypothetical protein